MIVKVLINTNVKTLNKVYDYKVPESLENKIDIGKRVEVNFGRGKAHNVDGIIVKIEKDIKEEDLNFKLKEVIKVLDEISYIDTSKLSLAKYMSYTYFCNVYDVLKLMLPPGTVSNASSKNMDDKFDIKIILLKSKMDIEYEIENEIIKSAKHIKLLRFLSDNDNVFLTDVISNLGISKIIVNTLEKKGYIALEKVKQEINTIDIYNIEKSEKKVPTPEQKIAIDTLKNAINKEKFEKFLLHGVTGSGKTEVYLQVIEETIKNNKKVIFLVPEISLTHQSVIRLVGRFGTKVAVLHSKMKITERKEEYKRILKGEVDIIIGARSAIFAPIKNVGLIILDEEHDPSYYSTSTPKYSTKEVAEYLCKENNAILLLGSATPEIITYYQALIGNIKLLTLKNRAGNASLPKIEIIDTKKEWLIGNKGLISQQLKQAIIDNKKNMQQSMIFLNRRGYEAYYKCKDCSYIFKCPNCDIALTYHKKNNLLTCHYCSHVEKNILCCPVCNSCNVTSSSYGTEKIEEELSNISSDLRILRMDADTTALRNSVNLIIDKFRKKEADILIGTQMISKGHDFEDVTLVGILGTDNLLALYEYTSNERAYQNLSQVAGRAGRAQKLGKVIIETSDVENYIINSVKCHDYLSFYKKEIDYRKIFEYPPFCDILLFELHSSDLNLLKKDAINFYNILDDKQVCNFKYFKIFSPKAPHIQKLNNTYRLNVLVKTRLDSNVYRYVYKKLKEFDNKRNNKVFINVTKNPISI